MTDMILYGECMCCMASAEVARLGGKVVSVQPVMAGLSWVGMRVGVRGLGLGLMISAARHIEDHARGEISVEMFDVDRGI